VAVMRNTEIFEQGTRTPDPLLANTRSLSYAVVHLGSGLGGVRWDRLESEAVVVSLGGQPTAPSSRSQINGPAACNSVRLSCGSASATVRPRTRGAAIVVTHLGTRFNG
jgi:hypothetical protein